MRQPCHRLHPEVELGSSYLVDSSRSTEHACLPTTPLGDDGAAPVHELSIATSIVTLTTDVLEREGETRPLEAVRIQVGDLAGVVCDALVFAWDVAAAGTPCAGARLEIEAVSGRIRCGACGEETELGSPPVFRCGGCGELSNDVVAGRELDLVSLELSDTPSPTADTPSGGTS